MNLATRKDVASILAKAKLLGLTKHTMGRLFDIKGADIYAVVYYNQKNPRITKKQIGIVESFLDKMLRELDKAKKLYTENAFVVEMATKEQIEELESLRVENRVSVSDLVEKAGYCYNTTRKILKGKPTTTQEQYITLKEALEDLIAKRSPNERH